MDAIDSFGEALVQSGQRRSGAGDASRTGARYRRARHCRRAAHPPARCADRRRAAAREHRDRAGGDRGDPEGLARRARPPRRDCRRGHPGTGRHPPAAAASRRSGRWPSVGHADRPHDARPGLLPDRPRLPWSARPARHRRRVRQRRRFHALPAERCPIPFAPRSVQLRELRCAGRHLCGSIVGLQASAATNPGTRSGVAPTAGRSPSACSVEHAVSITYRSGSKPHSRGAAGLGAYLIVQRYTSGRRW